MVFGEQITQPVHMGKKLAQYLVCQTALPHTGSGSCQCLPASGYSMLRSRAPGPFLLPFWRSSLQRSAVFLLAKVNGHFFPLPPGPHNRSNSAWARFHKILCHRYCAGVPTACRPHPDPSFGCRIPTPFWPLARAPLKILPLAEQPFPVKGTTVPNCRPPLEPLPPARCRRYVTLRNGIQPSSLVSKPNSIRLALRFQFWKQPCHCLCVVPNMSAGARAASLSFIGSPHKRGTCRRQFGKQVVLRKAVMLAHTASITASGSVLSYIALVKTAGSSFPIPADGREGLRRPPMPS